MARVRWWCEAGASEQVYVHVYEQVNLGRVGDSLHEQFETLSFMNTH